MRIRHDAKKCFAVVLEPIEPGAVTPPNSHENFAQMYFIVSGTARVSIGDEVRAKTRPAVAYIRQNTYHYVENTCDVPRDISTSASGRA